MNYQEAIATLQVPAGSNEAVVKKAFRDLSVKFHPDKNKEAGAEEKYKSITAAFTYLKEHNFEEEDDVSFNPFEGQRGTHTWTYVNGKEVHVNHSSGFSSFFRDMEQRAREQARERDKERLNTIFITLDVSLEEALLGCSKKISYKRREPCATCSSIKSSSESLPKKCEECNAAGKLVNPAIVLKQKEMNVKFKPFLAHQFPQRLPEAGHQDADKKWDVMVILNLKISEKDRFKIGGDWNSEIWSNEKISLLQALKGGEVEINTIKGKSKITLPPKITTGYKYLKPETGLPDITTSVIQFEVEYPKDTDNLIKFLEAEGK